jgi:hypothetical protein
MRGIDRMARRQCKYCQKSFRPKQIANAAQKFCTRRCVNDYRTSQTTGEYLCLHCKTPFRRSQSMCGPRMFCSRSCSYKQRPRKPKRFTCQHCKQHSLINAKNKRKKYCSYTCNGLARRSSTRPNTPRDVAMLATWGRKVRKRDGHQCVRCKCRYKLQAHHKKSFAEYPDLRYEVENGETLCTDCHAKEHPEIAALIKSKLR